MIVIGLLESTATSMTAHIAYTDGIKKRHLSVKHRTEDTEVGNKEHSQELSAASWLSSLSSFSSRLHVNLTSGRW